MRRLVLTLSSAVLAAGLAGCGSNNGNGDNTTTNDVTPGPSVSQSVAGSPRG